MLIHTLLYWLTTLILLIYHVIHIDIDAAESDPEGIEPT